MTERFLRQSMIIGEDATAALATKRVVLFGLGGVGSYAAEALARSGIGQIELIDHDTVHVSNVNRQLCALESTLGKAKVDVVADRLADINPDVKIIKRAQFFLPENADEFDFSSYDFVIDAIDTVSAKIEIAVRCASASVPCVSVMGTGNKLCPEMLEVSDLSKTSVCPLARVMRRELKKRGISHLRVVYSKEEPTSPRSQRSCEEGKKATVGSISFVPSVAGLLAASVAIKELIK